MMPRFFSAASILLSAFLLFQIQPVLARFALPWYGGSAAVWGTCILFFQSMLFAGYVYAHLLVRRVSPRGQALVHGTLLLASLAFLPVIPNAEWKPSPDSDPMLGILGMLVATIGLPYFLLSSTSPLVQAWRVRESPQALPYRFYALSNAASLGGLLAYPFVVERLWSLPVQAELWSLGYVGYALAFAMLAWTARSSSAGISVAAPVSPKGWTVWGQWIVLASLPSALSLAVTNHLTQNVAAIPLLWVLPLAIYLLTLIICFDGDGWYRPAFFLPCNVVLLVVAGVLLIRVESHTDLMLQVSVFCSLLLSLAMTLHGELVRRRPDGTGLTGFYLAMAFGGAVGGVSVGLGAPFLLRGYYELPLALSACAAALLMLEFRRRLLIDVVLGATVVWVWASSGGFIRANEAETLAAGRNFYGGLRIVDRPADGTAGARREMVHGAVVHGSQFLDNSRRRVATAYYAAGSGAELAIAGFRRQGASVGVIGLGTGAMAAWAQPGEKWRFYELNPMVLEFARRHFTYLTDAPAALDTVLGDGRLSLEREDSRQFHVLTVDAFSGDSIPVHLLALEAFAVYFRHLRSDGVLLVHVSNAVLDLRPVVTAAAATFGKRALEITVEPDVATLRGASTWVLVADESAFDARPQLVARGTMLDPDPGFRPWSDSYSNLLGTMKRRAY